MTNDKSSEKGETGGGRVPMVYHDFNVRFGGYNESDGGFKVWVEGETPGGAMKPDNAVARRYDPAAFWEDPTEAYGGLLGGLEKRALSNNEMYQLGAALADLCLPAGEVFSLFEKSLAALKNAGEGLRLRLHIDALQLTHLPWEFIAVQQATSGAQDTDFLALRREVSVVRTETVEAPVAALPARAKARVVVVLSEPKGQPELRVSEDEEAIGKAVEALNKSADEELIEVVWGARPATRDALAKALEGGADIFHFGGHAVFEQPSNVGKIILELPDKTGDFYPGAALAQLLRDSGARLVVLGACETGRRDGKNVWGGIAPALAHEKMPAVVANQFKIKDDSATIFASKLYHRVLSGYTVDEAMYEARRAIYQTQGLKNRDWGTPVLYLHSPGGILFPTPEPGSSSQPGPFLAVSNHFKLVEGEVIDVNIGRVTGGRIEVKSVYDEVKKGGKVTGVKIDSVG